MQKFHLRLERRVVVASRGRASLSANTFMRRPIDFDVSWAVATSSLMSPSRPTAQRHIKLEARLATLRRMVHVLYLMTRSILLDVSLPYQCNVTTHVRARCRNKLETTHLDQKNTFLESNNDIPHWKKVTFLDLLIILYHQGVVLCAFEILMIFHVAITQ